MLKTGAGLLRDAYVHIKLWWLPMFVHRALVYGDKVWFEEMQKSLCSLRPVGDLHVLLRCMHEIVPRNSMWTRILQRNRQSPRPDCPSGVDLGCRTAGGDSIRFNVWTDRIMNSNF